MSKPTFRARLAQAYGKLLVGVPAPQEKQSIRKLARKGGKAKP